MKAIYTFSKLTAALFAIVVLNACNKEQDELTNLDVYRKDAGQAEIVDISAINSAMVLKDRVNGVDYIFKNDVAVNASLSIEPGVTIMFENGAGLTIHEQGSISALGVASNKIVFTSKSGKRGDWKGITVLSNNAKNVLTYSKVEHGIDNVTIGKIGTAAKLEISYSEITAAKGYGVIVAKGSSLTQFSNNKIHTNTTYPLQMHLADASKLEDLNEFGTNGKEFIQLMGSGSQIILQKISLKKLRIPYVLSGQSIAGDMVEILAGARVYMDDQAELIIDGQNGQGEFSAIGTLAQPITISALYNGVGVWSSIQLRNSNSPNNKIEYCTISGGGKTTNNNEGMISLVNTGNGNSQIVIRNNNILNSASSGISIQHLNSNYNNDILTANSFLNCAKGNVHFE